MDANDEASTVFLPVAPKRGKAQQQTGKEKQPVLINEQDQSEGTNQTMTFTVSPDKSHIGLTREELEQYVNDPFWVRTRWALVILFWFIWTIMFVAAIAIVVLSPKCPTMPPKLWWAKQICYQVWTPAFSDANGDGVGDIAGLKSHLHDIADTGAKTIRLSAVMSHTGDSTMSVVVHSGDGQHVGTVDDFDELTSLAHSRGMNIVMDIPLSTFTTHPWFKSYQKQERPFDRFYAFDKIPDAMNMWVHFGDLGKRYVGVNGAVDAAYLNVDVPEVRQRIVDIFRFWLKHGVDGFYLPSIVQVQALTEKELSPLYAELRQAAEEEGRADVALFAKIDAHENSYRIRPTVTGAGKLDTVSIDMFSTMDNHCGPSCVYAMLQKEKEYFLSENSSSLFWQISDVDTGRLFSRMKNEERSQAVVFLFMTLPGSVGFVYGEELGLDGPGVVTMCWNDSVNGGFSNYNGHVNISPATNCPAKSLQTQSQNPKSYYSLFSKLAKYRNKADAIVYGSFDVALTPSQCIIIWRESTIASESVIGIVNLADKPCEASYHTDMKLKDAVDIRLMFSTNNIDTSHISAIDTTTDGELGLPPYQAVMFRYRRS